MFGQNKVKLLLVVLFITTLTELEVNGAVVNKTVIGTAEVEKDANEHGPFDAIRKAEEKRNLKEDAEYVRFQQFQQLLQEGDGGAASGNSASIPVSIGIVNVLLLSGLISYVVKFSGLF